MQPKSILVISSEIDEQEYLTKLLENMGKVQIATDPTSAISQVQLNTWDLVLLSLRFDRDKGDRFCEQLINQCQVKSQILLIGAPNSNFNLKRALAAGATDYISQPWQEEEILHQVQRCWTVWELQQQINESKANLREMAIELSKALATLREAEKQDYLTPVFNRSFFYQQLDHEWRRLSREKEAIAIVLFEIDYFRQLNALYGHQAGDECLQQVAILVREILKRPADLVARYADHQFSLLLPNTDAGGAIHVARLIQEQTQKLVLVQGPISLSIGISSTVPNLNYTSDRFLQTSEQALAEAKDQGRDRIILKAFEAPVVKNEPEKELGND